MQQQQRGITVLGLLILMTFVGLFVYGLIRLTPAFIEYMEISKTFSALQSETGGNFTPGSVRLAIEKRFSIDDITSLDPRDIEITRDGDEWTVHGAWDAQAPFIGNVSFLVHFDKRITLKTL